ncbi:hypothetical protein VIBNISOn1_210001 [Vibrio nigripulchritudo SOn1]|uniref:Uncharacterized protein n=1 Tax=Vibrio nigripulchritudo SOn1 TaxID=1238450 RepID=A0AAV2VQV6_9VIBR|nr:hypothetical protein VIBNISOn1_210001 [Vibrio nigripulchritudo SOn1]
MSVTRKFQRKRSVSLSRRRGEARLILILENKEKVSDAIVRLKSKKRP